MRRLRWVTAAVLLAALPSSASAKPYRAEANLPPGQSGHVSLTGVTSGTGSPHLYDQVDNFVNFRWRPFGFGLPGSSEQPRAGVTIVRDSYGIPAITAGNREDAWFGVGYAVAQDRLFQLELFRRATTGRLAEILGKDYLDDDLIARRDYYTAPEREAMFNAVPAPLRAQAQAYREGVNAWIAHVRTNPRDMPGEMVALGVDVQPITLQEQAAIGIFLARTVPSGDGNELENLKLLRADPPEARDVHGASLGGTVPEPARAHPQA
jgi:penicillin amidase